MFLLLIFLFFYFIFRKEVGCCVNIHHQTITVDIKRKRGFGNWDCYALPWAGDHLSALPFPSAAQPLRGWPQQITAGFWAKHTVSEPGRADCWSWAHHNDVGLYTATADFASQPQIKQSRMHVLSVSAASSQAEVLGSAGQPRVPRCPSSLHSSPNLFPLNPGWV